jgi:hypothetical protein
VGSPQYGLLHGGINPIMLPAVLAVFDVQVRDGRNRRNARNEIAAAAMIMKAGV